MTFLRGMYAYKKLVAIDGCQLMYLSVIELVVMSIRMYVYPCGDYMSTCYCNSDDYRFMV